MDDEGRPAARLVSVERVDVAILYEHAARELDVACILAHLLAARHGLSSRIIQQNHPDRSTIVGLRPSVVVLPFCYQQRSNNLFFLRWQEATFFNLTWEQLFYPGNARAKTPRGEFAVRHVIHNAWSDLYAGVLHEEGVPEDHIFISGQPAYALYGEPYRRYFRSRAELAAAHGLEQGRRWVIFPENYNWAFYGAGMLAQMVADGQSPDQVSTMVSLVTRSFAEGMRWCAAVARSGDVEVIIRPRPATPANVFRQRLGEVLGEIPPHLRVIQEDTVRDWILASDLVVSSSSTTLIEASIAGKPAYILEPLEWPESLRQAWHHLAPRLTSEERFLEVATTDGSGAPGPLADWARSTLLSRGDPIVAVADRLARIRSREVPVPEEAPWRSIMLPPNSWLARRLPDRMLFELRKRVLPLLPLRSSGPVSPEYRADVAALREVPDRIRRWGIVLDGQPATFELIA